ncbi:hypothetical protein [Lewinella cohaerens]|uniref:hypothetical protein n=1 Tax=Lewinella cohaerens TaxID=70995 RepID=UPI00036083BF|nr:hypothetical protein [Lewinella cohaerens]
MYELIPEYLERLETIAGEIQASEVLQQYLEEEEEEYFNTLKEMFEPNINLVYQDVAAHHPLQLIHLERILLDTAFEGLFLPRILGFSVLRGTVDHRYKYTRPQHHFQDILLAICNSANFDILKKRIGQTIQIGFALSSDIWVTNLINAIDNRRVRHYLQGLKSDRLRVLDERKRDYARYNRQFVSENYLSVVFPDTPAELTIEYAGLERFLLYRINTQEDNSSIVPPLDTFVSSDELNGTTEHMKIATLYGAFFELPDDSQVVLSEAIEKMRTSLPDADEAQLEFLLYLHAHKEVKLTPEADLNLAALYDRQTDDQLSDYFTIIEKIHTEGYTNEPTQEAIREVYLNHEGLSSFNEGIRRTIFHYFDIFVKNLEAKDYPEYFEITKLFAVYMGLFGNQKFNQDLKELSMAYVKKLLKVYTDKRGKDYQDIKKFVSATFLDFGFLTDKEIVNLFKTRRKRKKKEDE